MVTYYTHKQYYKITNYAKHITTHFQISIHLTLTSNTRKHTITTHTLKILRVTNQTKVTTYETSNPLLDIIQHDPDKSINLNSTINN